MTKAISWKFEEVGPMGGATGSAFANTLSSTGNPEEELAREAIQNSTDAVDSAGKPRVVFRLVRLEGPARSRFADALQLPSGLKPRLNALHLGRQNWLADPSSPLHLTFIDDYGTKGLHGDPHKRQSNFFKLLLSLGDVSKAGTGGSGGSYGYGKSALSMNSRIRTLVAYSAFEEDETGATARLMGCGYFAAHMYKGNDCTGRAWFGTPTKEGADPLIDEEAHKLAEALGFESRRGNKFGTSILLVDSLIDAKELLRSIEDWWWPRIEDNALDVEVRSGSEAHFPKPRARPDLLPFIECYRLAQGRSEPAGPHQRREGFNKFEGLELGSFGVSILPTEQAQALKDVHEDRVGAVALMRSPRMVVKYDDLGREAPPAVGVFIADDEVDDILKMSEPPAHNRWEEKSTRLAEVADEETARLVVHTIRSRLRERIRKLQQQQEAPREREETRLEALEKELGSILRLGKGGGGGGTKAPVPVEMELGDPVAAESGKGGVVSRTRLTVRLKPDAEDSKVKAIVTVHASVLEDEDGNEGERLAIHARPDSKSKDACEELETDDSEVKFVITLTRDDCDEVSLSLSTDPYDADWAAKFGVHIEPAKRGK